MDRRNIIRGVAPVTAVGAESGITCITCAEGLETLLKGVHGVTRVKAGYPQNTALAGIDQHAIAEKQVREFTVTLQGTYQ